MGFLIISFLFTLGCNISISIMQWSRLKLLKVQALYLRRYVKYCFRKQEFLLVGMNGLMVSTEDISLFCGKYRHLDHQAQVTNLLILPLFRTPPPPPTTRIHTHIPNSFTSDRSKVEFLTLSLSLAFYAVIHFEPCLKYSSTV